METAADGDAAGARREQRDQERGDAHQAAGHDVAEVVHAAVQPRQRHDRRQRDGKRPDRDRDPALREAGRQHQRQRAVDGDRGRHVPRRVALVAGQVVESRHQRSLAMDDQARHAVGGELEHAGRGDERRCADPVADQEDDHRQHHEARQHRDVTDHRADVRQVVQRRGALLEEPA